MNNSAQLLREILENELNELDLPEKQKRLYEIAFYSGAAAQQTISDD